jgi:hypothetical protein
VASADRPAGRRAATFAGFGGTRPGPASAAALVLLGLAVLLAYLPAVIAGVGFVSDDFMILERVRAADGLRGATRFFGQSFYDYYRPAGFVSFAIDWALWGARPAGYHVTSILLHLLNTWLVFALARRLLSVEMAVLAAALFALHVVNQEAVYWISARFDLLATAGGLLVILLVASDRRWRHPAAALVFLAALLSKESVAALPLAAGAYVWIVRRGRAADLLRLFAWLGAAGVAYAFFRQASGLSAAGGAGRLPKLAVLAALLIWQVASAHPASAVLRDGLRRRRGAICAGLILALAAGGALAGWPERGAAALAAFRAFGFDVLHLVSPVSPEPWLSPLPTWLAAAGLGAAVAAGLAAWLLGGRAVPAFLGLMLVAALLPVSSMTEGPRYLYLASVPVSMFAAWAASSLPRRATAPAFTLAAAALVVFSWQVRAKGRDWLWASDMTARAVATVVEAAGPGCRDAHVVFATAPVRTHGVYANINHEALAAIGGCRPASVRTLIRTGYDNPSVDAALESDRLVLRVVPYRGGFVATSDFQRYATRIEAGIVSRIDNPFGALETAPDGEVLTIRQHLPPGASSNLHWFVFSRGSLRVLLPMPVGAAGPPGPPR